MTDEAKKADEALKAKDAEIEALKAELEAANKAVASVKDLPKKIDVDDPFKDLDPEKEVDVVTTAPGAWGMDGILSEGTKKTIPVQSFSSAWMKPANAASAKVVNAWLMAKEADMQRRADVARQRKNVLAALK